MLNEMMGQWVRPVLFRNAHILASPFLYLTEMHIHWTFCAGFPSRERSATIEGTLFGAATRRMPVSRKRGNFLYLGVTFRTTFLTMRK